MLRCAMALSYTGSMARQPRPILPSEEDRRELERLVRGASTPAGLSRRARAVLLMADGVSGTEVAQKIGYTVVQVSRIRRRFAEAGLDRVKERPRSGRPPRVSCRKRAHAVALTLKPPHAGATPLRT